MKTNISLSWDHGPIYHHLWPLSKYQLKYQLFSIKLFFHQTTLTGYKFISKCLFLSIFWFPMRLSYFLKFLFLLMDTRNLFQPPLSPLPPIPLSQPLPNQPKTQTFLSLYFVFSRITQKIPHPFDGIEGCLLITIITQILYKIWALAILRYKASLLLYRHWKHWNKVTVKY